MLWNCIAILSLLSAVGNPKVNYLSLDIEGAELQVLRSIPWHLVDIEVEDHPSNATFSLHPAIHPFIIYQVITVEFDLLGRVFPGTRTEVFPGRH